MKAFSGSNRAMRAIRLAQNGFAVAGVLALGYCLAVHVEATYFQAKEARQFASELHAREIAAARSSTPTAAPIARRAAPPDGAVVGQLEIPRLRVAVMVVEGVDDGDLKRAAGHIPGTALPGEPGNVAIAGHRDTFFRSLRGIERNDTITLNTVQSTYHYRVVSTKVVRPEDVGVLYPTGHDSLTLVTCFPFDYIGSAPKRFIVRAERTVAQRAAF
jgi:sortase A